jgi:hypothetical protein
MQQWQDQGQSGVWAAQKSQVCVAKVGNSQFSSVSTCMTSVQCALVKSATEELCLHPHTTLLLVTAVVGTGSTDQCDSEH